MNGFILLKKEENINGTKKDKVTKHQERQTWGLIYITYETTQGEQFYCMGLDGILCRTRRPIPDKLYNLDIAEAYQVCRYLSEIGAGRHWGNNHDDRI